MTYDEAAAFVMPWGGYAGRTLDDIASTCQGLRYLAWMGAMMLSGSPVREALEVYLADPTITKQVERARACGRT